MSLLDRFNNKFEVSATGCWLWIGARGGRDDRGWIWGGAGIGKSIFAHRASWILHRGDIPDGMKVLHNCDVPHCVNPNHLFLGTQDDNVQDCRKKGRIVIPKREPGAGPHITVLTPDDIRDIRKKEKVQTLYAAEYNVTRMTISDIQRRKSWRWVK